MGDDGGGEFVTSNTVPFRVFQLLLRGRGLLCRDPHAKQELDLPAIPERALEIEEGSVFDPGRDGNGEGQSFPPGVEPDIPLRSLAGLIGGEGKIMDEGV